MSDSEWRGGSGDTKSEERGDQAEKERIETDNNMEPARPVTETKQKQPFDTKFKLNEGEETGGVAVHLDKGRERWHHMAGRSQK